MLQVCQAHPTDVIGLRLTLADPSTLDGVHLQVTARSYRSPLTVGARIRTIPVRTHPNGHVEIIAESGTYRFDIRDNGAATVRVRSPQVTHVQVTDSATVTINASAYVTVTAGDSAAVTIDADTDAHGLIAHTAANAVAVTGEGAANFRRIHLTHARTGERLNTVDEDTRNALTQQGLRDARTWGWR